MTELTREELGLKIYEVTRSHADGYTRAITSFSTEQEKDMAEKCSCAASNTGYFVLMAIGYTKEDLERFRSAHQS